MTWDGIERRKNVRMSDAARALWFAELEAEISDEMVRAMDIQTMALPELIKNINRRFVRGNA